MTIDLTAVQARYSRALDAKPGKGPYTERGIAALTDSVCDVPDLLAEVERLNQALRGIETEKVAAAFRHLGEQLEAHHPAVQTSEAGAPLPPAGARTVRDPMGRLITVRDGEHVLVANDEGDPVCACRWYPRSARTQAEAATAVRNHIRNMELGCLFPDCIHPSHRKARP